MISFDELYDLAAARKGGDQVLESLLPQPKTPQQIRAISDDRFLAQMTKSIFQSGFVYRVVENKWPGFEEVFEGFDPGKLSVVPDPVLDAWSQDTRIIRNGTKVRTVRHNAAFIMDLAAEHGQAAAFFADWPVDDIVGLWDILHKRGSRLGGNTGSYFLRNMGKDTFLMTNDVVTGLTNHGIMTGKPTSKRERKAAQTAFNQWQQQSGRPLCQISRVLAFTVGENYGIERL